MTWQFTLAGFLVGVLVGLTGMGGGSLMTPILIFLFGFKPSVAIGTDILHGAVFKSFGAARHRKLGHVHARLAAWILVGSAPMSLIGVALGAYLVRHYGKHWQDVQTTILGVALVACGIGFLVKAFLRPRADIVSPFYLRNRDRIIAVCLGIVGGFVVGLTSVGSGTFFGLVMMLAYPISAATIVGTDIFQAAVLLWVAGIGHFVAGNVDLHATAWLLLGSIPGVLIGAQFTVRLPDRAIRMALATTLFLSGLKLIDFPGSNVVVIVGLAIGLVALAVVGARDWVGSRRTAVAAAVPVPAEPDPGAAPVR